MELKQSEIIWRGRQWAVTDHGLETLGEPYHYHLEKGQLVQRWDDGSLGLPQHLMEKTWLDVDDFLTAYLVALAVHAEDIGPVPKTDIEEALEFAIAVRRNDFTFEPGPIPRPLNEISKDRPEPVWKGSYVVGARMGGRNQPLPFERDEDGVREKGDDSADRLTDAYSGGARQHVAGHVGRTRLATGRGSVAGLLASPGTVRFTNNDRAWEAVWRRVGDMVIVDSAYGALSAPLRGKEPKVVAEVLLKRLAKGRGR
ncbi:MAG: hypothetical protein JWP35_4629 [Caulobacter sp.]|nr:hypothetical protein [Caulobacter sp.]